jgi:hypothetical protein
MSHDTDEMERRIDEVLHKNRENLHLVKIPRTPLEELIAWEEGENDGGEFAQRVEIFHKLLDFFFQDGPEPLQLLRHVFAVTKALRPDLLGDMSLEDISIICADGGRATVSARIQRIYNGTLKKAGMADVRAPFQKVGNFSAPQKGNTNRKRSVRKGKRKKREC